MWKQDVHTVVLTQHNTERVGSNWNARNGRKRKFSDAIRRTHQIQKVKNRLTRENERNRHSTENKPQNVGFRFFRFWFTFKTNFLLVSSSSTLCGELWCDGRAHHLSDISMNFILFFFIGASPEFTSDNFLLGQPTEAILFLTKTKAKDKKTRKNKRNSNRIWRNQFTFRIIGVFSISLVIIYRQHQWFRALNSLLFFFLLLVFDLFSLLCFRRACQLSYSAITTQSQQNILECQQNDSRSVFPPVLQLGAHSIKTSLSLSQRALTLSTVFSSSPRWLCACVVICVDKRAAAVRFSIYLFFTHAKRANIAFPWHPSLGVCVRVCCRFYGWWAQTEATRCGNACRCVSMRGRTRTRNRFRNENLFALAIWSHIHATAASVFGSCCCFHRAFQWRRRRIHQLLLAVALRACIGTHTHTRALVNANEIGARAWFAWGEIHENQRAKREQNVSLYMCMCVCVWGSSSSSYSIESEQRNIEKTTKCSKVHFESFCLADSPLSVCRCVCVLCRVGWWAIIRTRYE